MNRRAQWKDEPDDHDFTAALSFLRLLLDEPAATAVVARLAAAPMVQSRGRDILRASGLPLLPADHHDVAKDIGKVEAGKPLSPVLLVRGDLGAGIALTIADGYHRICACIHLDDEAEIPSRLADRE